MTEENLTNGWVKVYHPSGVLVTFPLAMNELTSIESADLVMCSVDNILAAGFSPDAPGLEDGELMEEMSHIARREGSDQTAIVDFYSSNTKLEKKFMHVYLNTPDDVAAFESATGVKLDLLNIYDGTQAIERTSPKASKYVVALPRSIKLVYKISSKWEQWNQAGKEGKEPHKRLLVRYEVARKPEGGQPGESEKDAAGVTQYKKLSGELVTMIVKATGLKPSIVSPILAKISSDTISYESALKIVTSNINKESA